MTFLRNFGGVLRSKRFSSNGSSFLPSPATLFSSSPFLQLQHRGIKVKVMNGNLEQALQFMQRKMIGSGMERLIRRAPTHHLKNSDKRILAKKNLERKIKSQDLSKKLRAILIKKVRGL